jgi:beta-glucanase (GH16 family)
LPGSNPFQGSEIQTLSGKQGLPGNGYGYGYYETKMQVTTVPGECVSFFWIEAPDYGPHEWDIEFLTNEPWGSDPKANGQVHLTIHPSGDTYVLDLPFNPTQAFHRYGFLWTAGTLVYTVDGQAAYTFHSSDLTFSGGGFIMANAWTGAADWGGGPPASKATSAYDWMKFWPDLTSIPAD